ncbi:hypothetical protein [Luteibacter sp. RCC_6_2]|uniref:hypothetical protein n=1 Tax=Luteibacter sp. RCC_6_2 TaxID=3239223 RepID=UPI003525A95B
MNAASQGRQNVDVQGYFKGVAVVIDDSIGTEGDDLINEIIQGIKDGGGHTVNLTSLPDDTADLDNFSNVSFFIMDWNLSGFGFGITIDKKGKDAQAAANIAFLKRLGQHRHAPVFIFTHNNVDEVRQYLVDADLYPDDGSEQHLMVRDKAEVGAKVYDVLNQWAEKTPSALVLKKWERDHVKALNAFFADFHDRNPYWPVMLWQTFEKDEVGAANELGHLISRLVTARMPSLDVDLKPFVEGLDAVQAANAEAYQKALLEVLQGERVVPGTHLEKESFAPGDFFVKEENGERRYFINIRAECDCVIRGKTKDAQLYLLKGRELLGDDLAKKINFAMGNLNDQHNEEIVFAMHDGKAIRFGFRDLKVVKWNEFKDHRAGRLLSPFITRLLQRYAAYSQRPGLPRLPAIVLGAEPVTAAPGNAGDGAECECELPAA